MSDSVRRNSPDCATSTGWWRLAAAWREDRLPELYEICVTGVDDVRAVREALLTWLRDHPERVDRAL